MIIMRTEEQFAEGFDCGFDCAMQVAAELAPSMGFTEEQALRFASCLGVGAGQGALCGAVVGALIAIGWKYGNTEPDDMATRGLCLSKRTEFYDLFREEFGGITCPEVLKLDLRNPEEAKMAREKGLIKNLCPKACRFAVITAKRMLED